MKGLSRRAVLQGGVAAISVIALGGCAPQDWAVTASPTDRSVPLAAGLFDAWRDGDENGFLAWFSNRELGRLWFRNLRQFTHVTFEPGGDDGELVKLAVSERAPLDTASAQHRFGLAATDGTTGILVSAPRTTPRPIWVSEAITVNTRSRATVLSGASVPSGSWLDAAAQGVDDVAARCPSALTAGWSGNVVVAVPALLATFVDALGVTQDAYRDVAAVAWAEGSSKTAPMRVFVNDPLCRDLAAIDRRVLLAHETTHVATRATLAQAPHWLSEGLAERVGLSASPGHRARNRQLAKEFARNATVPLTLPTASDFEPGESEISSVYALSEQAVSALFAHAGQAAVEFCLAVGGGRAWPIPEATVTAWYQEQIANL